MQFIELFEGNITERLGGYIVNILNQPITILFLVIFGLIYYRKLILKDIKFMIDTINIKIDNLSYIVHEHTNKIEGLFNEQRDLKETMVAYKVMNQECMQSEIVDISRIIRMSADSISNICAEYVCGKRNRNKETFSVEELMMLVTSDVQRDRLQYHSSLVENGVNPHTIKKWEETEAVMFPKFGIYCRDFANGYIKLSGNGELDNLIRTQGKVLADRLYDEFMCQLKAKLIEK
jgi:hypothetical protein